VTLPEWQIGIGFGLIGIASGFRKTKGRRATFIGLTLVAIGLGVLMWAMYSS
jgi:hypothetical protein